MKKLKMLSEHAWIVSFGDSISEETTRAVQSFCTQLARQKFRWLVEIVPSYSNVCIYVDVWYIAWQTSQSVEAFIAQQIEPLYEVPSELVYTGRCIEIPVRYNGPDLAYVAAYHQLSEAEVIARHSRKQLFVHMLGFAPGFAFLGGMDETLATPRRSEPRVKIDAGAVAIGGAQTAVYPFDTPGGWHIIGYTDMPMFLRNEAVPSRLRVGDRVQFVPI